VTTLLGPVLAHELLSLAHQPVSTTTGTTLLVTTHELVGCILGAAHQVVAPALATLGAVLAHELVGLTHQPLRTVRAPLLTALASHELASSLLNILLKTTDWVPVKQVSGEQTRRWV
jgi:hypothetical protein